MATFFGTTFEFRDIVQFLALVVAVGTFIWKLYADTRLARYRETVAFLEKRDDKLREQWRKIESATLTGEDLLRELRAFTAQLELVSLLIEKDVFDTELVYNYWWAYFAKPLAQPQVAAWISTERAKDSAVLTHYKDRCSAWATRIAKETGQQAPTFPK